MHFSDISTQLFNLSLEFWCVQWKLPIQCVLKIFLQSHNKYRSFLKIVGEDLKLCSTYLQLIEFVLQLITCWGRRNGQ